MKKNISINELADKMVKMLFDAGYDADGAIRVIRMARKKYNELKKNKK